MHQRRTLAIRSCPKGESPMAIKSRTVRVFPDALEQAPWISGPPASLAMTVGKLPRARMDHALKLIAAFCIAPSPVIAQVHGVAVQVSQGQSVPSVAQL